MKPRLNAPLTQEDFDIWDRISEPYGIKPGIPLWGYIESDRRDADLMYWAQSEGRWIQTQYGVSHHGGPLGLWDIDLGGAAQR
jgi:hypothetical protein